MVRKHRIYTSEFRARAVSLVVDAGVPAVEVSRDLEVKSSTLHTWLKQARSNESGGNSA